MEAGVWGWQTRRIWVFLTLVLLAPVAVRAVSFDLFGTRMECVMEELHKGEELTGSYAVSDGRDQITVKITDPQDIVVYSEMDVGEGKFSFRAEREGTYDLCFSNHGHSTGKKTVDLVLQKDIPPLDLGTASKEGVERLQKETSKVLRVVGMVEFQQSRFMQLHDRHTAVLKRTNRRVKLWTLFECLCVIAVSAVQIVYFRRLFQRQGSGLPGKGRLGV